MSNVSAFLRVIREGESNQSDDAYTIINGGEHFQAPPWVHPFDNIPTTQGGKAAGAYGFLGTTWHRLGMPDFSPENQDRGAIKLIQGRGALDAVMAGNLELAIEQLREEWVSLPILLANGRAAKVFAEYQTSEPTITAAPTQQGASMPFLALLPLIAQFIPQIMTLIKPNSVSTAKDAAVTGTILNTVVQAAGILNPDGTQAPVNAATVGQAADKMSADPALAKTVQTAVVTHPEIMPVLEVGGGIAAARTANAAAAMPDVPWWSGFSQPVFVFGLILCGMILLILGNILGLPWGGEFQSWSSEVRASVISAVIGGALGAITGYWFGTTQQSGKKDQVIAQQAVAND